MANIKVDTKKIKNAGNDIKDLSYEFINLINSFYSRINKIPTATHEWVGDESLTYVKMCMSEKENYLRFADSLKSLGNNLVDFSDKIDDTIREVNDEL